MFLVYFFSKLKNLATIKATDYLATDSDFLQTLSSDEVLNVTYDYGLYLFFEVECNVQRRDARYPEIQTIR